jgi:hypothetical protein
MEMPLIHQNLTPRVPSMKMLYPSSQLHVPTFWIEYFRYVEVLTPNYGNMQAVMKTWLKNESTITKHGVVPIRRNLSLGVQNSKIQNFVHIFIGLPRQRLPL